MRRSLWGIAGFVVIAGALLGVVKLVYGGGRPYPHVATPPVVSVVEVAAELPLPPGCVTVAPDGRVFFDTHPFAAPGRFGAAHVFEWTESEVRPWPSVEAQSRFVAPFGIHADDHGRVWVTEPATLDRSGDTVFSDSIARAAP